MHETAEVAEARPVWAWIDLEALRHNARRALELAEGRAVIGVVKANAYGHGASAVARGLLAAGVGRLAVVSVAEGAELRRAGIVAPILLMGGIEDRLSAERALKWGLTPVLHDRAGLELALAVGRRSAPLAVEVEVDTGMRRMGVAPGDASKFLRAAAEASQLTLTGIYTHLARADEDDVAASREQFAQLARIVEAAGPAAARATLHVANSGGVLRRAAIESDQPGRPTGAVRPGLMLYGVSPFAQGAAGAQDAADGPSGEKSSSASPVRAEALGLRPVMTLAARVVALRSVAKGEAVGYGGQWRAPRATRIATLPLGYADGIPRAILGRGEVLLAGARRPIVGRVSMDYITVDVGPGDDGPSEACRLGSVATIFGLSPEGERLPVEALAAAAGTIGYEILTGVGDRVARHVADGPPTSLEPGPLDRAV